MIKYNIIYEIIILFNRFVLKKNVKIKPEKKHDKH